MLTFLLDHTLSFLLWLIEIFDAFLPNRFLEVKCISPSGRSSWQLFSESSIIKFVFACVYLKFQSWAYQNHCQLRQLHQQKHLVCFFASKFILMKQPMLTIWVVLFFEADIWGRFEVRTIVGVNDWQILWQSHHIYISNFRLIFTIEFC